MRGNMRYKCLVFDHDDTVVNSTATIHYPCFLKYLSIHYPERSCSLEEYFLKNFHPGFVQMCKEDFGMTEEDMDREVVFWTDYVKEHIPQAYPGMREIMERQRSQGGLICVVSHSFENYILRDYRENSLPEPDAVYGWSRPLNERKPNPFPLKDIMERFDLKPEELLMIDDLKPGYDMAASCGVDFAAAGWASDIPQIESFMRQNCRYYFKTVGELADFLG